MEGVGLYLGRVAGGKSLKPVWATEDWRAGGMCAGRWGAGRAEALAPGSSQPRGEAGGCSEQVPGGRLAPGAPRLTPSATEGCGPQVRVDRGGKLVGQTQCCSGKTRSWDVWVSLPRRKMDFCVHQSSDFYGIKQARECGLFLEHKRYKVRVFICPVHYSVPRVGRLGLI